VPGIDQIRITILLDDFIAQQNYQTLKGMRLCLCEASVSPTATEDVTRQKKFDVVQKLVA